MQKCRFNGGERESLLTCRDSARDCHNADRNVLFFALPPPPTKFSATLKGPESSDLRGNFRIAIQVPMEPFQGAAGASCDSLSLTKGGQRLWFSPTVHPLKIAPTRWHCDYANEPTAKCVFKGIMFIIYLLPVDSLSRLSSNPPIRDQTLVTSAGNPWFLGFHF